MTGEPSIEVPEQRDDESQHRSAVRSWFHPIDLVIVTGLFALIELLATLAGLPTAKTSSPAVLLAEVNSAERLLDAGALQHHLISSLLNLRSQPPLWNLVIGILLKAPAAIQGDLVVAVLTLLSLAVALTTYLAMAALGVNRWVAIATTVIFVVADPSQLIQGRWLQYGVATAALATASIASLAVFGRTRSRWALGLGITTAVLLFLTNTTYQLPYLVAFLAIVALTSGLAWRQLLSIAVIPCVLAGLWTINDLARFGTLSTSDWAGMNLAKITVHLAPASQLDPLIAHHQLSSISLIRPFAPLHRYAPRYVTAPSVGPFVRVERAKPGGAPNLNNDAYATVSARYLSADLAYIRLEPGSYIDHVGIASSLFFIPGDQTNSFANDRLSIAGYAEAYDRVVLLQASPFGNIWHPTNWPSAFWHAYFVEHGFVPGLSKSSPPGVGQLSFTVLFEWGVGIVGGIWLGVVLWRRRDRRASALVAALMTMLWGFAATSLVEAGENMRFRAELGGIPVIVAVVVVTELVRRLRQRSS